MAATLADPASPTGWPAAWERSAIPTAVVEEEVGAEEAVVVV